MNPIAAIQPQCPYCETMMVWGVELLEYLQKQQEEDNEFDQAILEAIKAQNGKNKVIHMEDIPFFIWLADDPPSIFVAGWCPQCKRVSAPVFSLRQVLKLIQESRRRLNG